ncbi:MAG: hypothetical protein MUE41_14800 [Gemmatimonadaceae bacterium]|nr:hypothetical protein [Gemmatimonadaceae bacterium]
MTDTVARAYPLLADFLAKVREVNPSVGRFTTSGLQPVLGLVGTPVTGTALAAAITGLDSATRTKYAMPLRFLKWTHPSLPTGLSDAARALRNVLVVPSVTTEQIRRELHALPLAAAKANERALRALVTEMPDLEYIAVDGLTVAMTAAGTCVRQNNSNGEPSARYRSRQASLYTKIWAIVPPTQRYSVGWIQVCDRRDQRNIYADEGLETRWEISGTYPINDAANSQCFPFYYDAQSNGARAGTVAAARDVLLPTDNSLEFELTDDIGSYAREVLPYRIGTRNASTRLARVTRTQAFRAWFVYVRGDATKGVTETILSYANRFRPLVKVTYEFDLTVTMTWPSLGAPQRQLTERPLNPTTAVCDFSEGIPSAGMVERSMNNEDAEYVYRNGTRHGSYAGTPPIFAAPSRPLPPPPLPVPGNAAVVQPPPLPNPGGVVPPPPLNAQPLPPPPGAIIGRAVNRPPNKPLPPPPLPPRNRPPGG